MQAWTLWLFPLGAVAACFLIGRYNHLQVLHDWEFPLTDEGRVLLEDLRFKVDVDGLLVEDAERAAEAACLGGNLADATALLRMAHQVLQDATPDRLQRLRAMAVMARMAAAIVPPPPLRPREYRTPAVSALAHAATVLHHFLVTAAERMVLKIYVIGLGLRVALSAAHCSGEAAIRLPAFATATADWHTLDREHVEAFEMLMRSLAACPVSVTKLAHR